MGQTLYSQLKPAWHPDTLAVLREGRIPPPVHVQLILSDLCNQDCSFCLTEDAIVHTLQGDKSIAAIRQGDWLWGPDGQMVQVMETSARYADEIIEIEVGGRVLKATPEHPILTSEGWKAAGTLRPGDCAVVRVWVWGTGDAELSWRQVEQAHQSPWDGRQEANKETTRGGPTIYVAEQSHEAIRGCGKGVGSNFGSTTPEIPARAAEYSGGCKEAYALGCQSYEEQSRASCGAQENNVYAGTLAKRTAIYAMVGNAGDPIAVYGVGGSMDWQEESGFPSPLTEESGRADAEDVLCRPEALQNGEELRNTNGRTLYIEGLAGAYCVGKIVEGLHSGRIDKCISSLCIAGIVLERGLGLRPITSVRRLAGRVRVYNLACPPIEAFEANGVVVHNCAYRMSAGLSNELFVGESKRAKIGTNNPIRQIPTDKALEIVEDCAELGVKAIQFTGGGEPTVHPQHLEIIHRAQTLGMETALVTNGLKLDPSSPTIHALKWIRVSIDAGDAETYAQVRRVPKAHFAKVWNNVRALGSAAYTGVLGIGFVVTPDNYITLVAATILAEDAGADNIRVGAVFSAEGLQYYPGLVIPKIVKAIAVAKETVKGQRFQLIDLFGRRLGDLESGSPDDSTCHYQHFTVYIGGDLNVYRCCNTAYTLAGKVGNLKEQRFLDFMREGVQESYYPFDARACRYCQFIGQNKAIASLITPPDHVAFV